MQVFTVTGLFAGQHNTKLYGTITGVICHQFLQYFLTIALISWRLGYGLRT